MSSIDAYRNLLLRLLPPGRAFNREAGSKLYQLMEALGVELSRVDSRAKELLAESDPRTTTELIEDWERLVGIPDDCQTEVSASLAERRADVVRKLTNGGGATPAFFVALAAYLGYDVEVQDTYPFRCGKGRCGDPIYGIEWAFWFQVITANFDTQIFRAGAGRCGDRLRVIRNDLLECVISKAKPAHTEVQFLYTEE